MIFSTAYAQQTGGGPAIGSDPIFGMVIPLLAMVGIFYFLVIRPQQRRQKEMKEMLDKVRRGDTVVTAGGFVGRVTRVSDNSDEIEVELSEAMKVRVVKSTLLEVRARGEPVKETA